jgi:hypothetical protein
MTSIEVTFCVSLLTYYFKALSIEQRNNDLANDW